MCEMFAKSVSLILVPENNMCIQVLYILTKHMAQLAHMYIYNVSGYVIRYQAILQCATFSDIGVTFICLGKLEYAVCVQCVLKLATTKNYLFRCHLILEYYFNSL